MIFKNSTLSAVPSSTAITSHRTQAGVLGVGSAFLICFGRERARPALLLWPDGNDVNTHEVDSLLFFGEESHDMSLILFLFLFFLSRWG